MLEVAGIADLGASDVPTSAAHSFYDYVIAFSKLSIPLTVFLVLIGLAMIALRLLEVEATMGKYAFKLHRPKKAGNQPVTPVPYEGVVESIPAPDSNPAPIIPQSTPQAGDGKQEDFNNNSSNDRGIEYIFAKDLASLDKQWPKWKENVDDDDIEFWETNYRYRRAELGADRGRDAVQQLIVENPTWAYPFSILVDWNRADHNYNAAKDHLANGLKHQNSPRFGDVLSSGVKLHFAMGGDRGAAEFCFEWVKANIPERVKAQLLSTLADLLKESGAIEGYRIANEWAILLHPSNKINAFPLAYSYADDRDHWIAAISTYLWTIGNDGTGPVSYNNLAVLLGHLDKANQIEAYEKGIAGGNKFAIVNLAQLLVNDGYISTGERLLATIGEPGDAAELHASTNAAILAARRKLNEKREEIVATVKAQIDPFRKVIARSFRHLQSDAPRASGHYVSADNLVQALVEGNEVKCSIRIGQDNYSGTLRWQVSCYAGSLYQEGNGLLRPSFEATLFDQGEGTVSFVRWPNSIRLDQSLVILELHHSISEPIPLPPPSAMPPTRLGDLLLPR